MRAAMALTWLACGGRLPEPREAEAPAPATGSQVLSPDQWEEIDTLIRQKIRVVSVACYDPELSLLHDRKLQGSVTLNIHLLASGQASDADVKETTWPTDRPEYGAAAEAVESCLTAQIKTWAFPVTGADAWFLYTFRFEPQY